MRRVAWSAACVTLIAIAIVPNVWFARAVSGKVTDPQGHPLRGSVVLATWQLRSPTGSWSLFNAVQAITRADGTFELRAWGPKLNLHPLSSMFKDDPVVWVVHAGYVPLRLSNSHGMEGIETRRFEASSSLNPLSITMEPLRARFSSSINASSMEGIREFATQAWSQGYGSKPCLWNMAPEFAQALLAAEMAAGVEAPSFRSEHLCAYPDL